MEELDVALSVGMGVALAAAAGFRVFVPLLATGLAIHFGGLQAAAGFEWLGEPWALVTLGVATVLEVAAYYVPGVDHVLDAIAAPLALVAGVVVAASVMADLPGWLRWLAAIVAGGSATAATYSLSSLVRAKSGVATGGLGNPIVASGELVSAAGLALLALLVPLLALAAVAALVLLALRRLLRRRRPA
ncbi:MAG: DUF4126 domain-containing protein [Steroidobacteraceae bacterium]|jgi:hypothetical protein|nr:DUF4126 domain-containing protein [Steroidobacteraceae bacterium]